MTIQNKSIEEFVNDELKQFSMYVIENRAIPSCIDGLKPVHRKILKVALDKANNKKLKVSEMGSALASYNYAHGDASGAVVTLARGFDNNIPLLEQHGSFGSRLIRESAAPRYIYVKLSEAYSKYFSDEDVLSSHSDLDNPEPQQYLPIIPWVLVNGTDGIAVGFSTTILPRDIDAIKKATIECIKTGKIDQKNNPLYPSFPSFKGTVEFDEEKYYSKGIVEEQGLQYHITELPIGYDREKYIKVLSKLMDNGKIQDYTDPCTNGFYFIVNVTRKQREIIRKDPYNFFKLYKSHSDNLTTLDEKGNLILFDNVYELIKYFCEFRLKKCEEQIKFNINKFEKIIFKESKKIEFIKLMIDNKIDFKKTTKKQLLEFIHKNIGKHDFVDNFVNIPIYKFTKDEINNLEKTINSYQGELDIWSALTPKQYFLSQLNNI